MGGMRLTKKNVKAATEILAVLADNKCTIADTRGIFIYIEDKIRDEATVPKKDFSAELRDLYDRAGED